MLIINGVDWGYYIVLGGWFLIPAAVQLLLCRKSRGCIRFLPLLGCAAVLLVALLLALGVFGSGNGFIPANSFLALVLAVPACCVLAGVGLGWLLHRMIK